MTTPVVVNVVRAGFYLDSVALMRMSQEIGALEGVEEAVLMIGTDANKSIMDRAGVLEDDGRAAGPNDLVIALRARDADCAARARDHAVAAIGRRVAASTSDTALRPRGLAGALEVQADTNLVMVSTPGEFAAREARLALSHGLNVLIFSDNVPLEEERELKLEARRRGLLVMGPDCGTAYLAGVPIAFANEVPSGPIGVIAASGTGLQEVSVLAARAGSGISHGIGVGGRDLSDAVGGLSTLAALELVARDASTEHLLVISKPPGEATAEVVLERLSSIGKPVTVCFLGWTEMAPKGGVVVAPTLKAAVESTLGHGIGGPSFDLEPIADAAATGLDSRRRLLRGLYTGGTLCAEAQVVMRDAGLVVDSNAPLDPEPASRSEHVITDLGADEYTRGRPHPMIEPAVRTGEIERALADPAVAVVLLDLVLGYGAHPDPAAAVAAAVGRVAPEGPVLVASVCGAPRDPQGFQRQVDTLTSAGVLVAPSNADAALLSARICGLRG